MLRLFQLNCHYVIIKRYFCFIDVEKISYYSRNFFMPTSSRVTARTFISYNSNSNFRIGVSSNWIFFFLQFIFINNFIFVKILGIFF